MELKEHKYIGNLNERGCQVITQSYIELNGQKQQVGEVHSCFYPNTEQGKKDIQEREPENISSAALAMWNY